MWDIFLSPIFLLAKFSTGKWGTGKWPCSYSYLNAIIGSTFIARRAGM
jgi:hypothetical protein